MTEKHIVVIGGGVAGYPAAIRAARLGARVTLVEKNLLGGTCLNWGCIPTKVMLHTTEFLEKIHRGRSLGLTGADGVGIDLSVLIKRKQDVVEHLTNGVRALLRQRRIEYISGTATFENAREIRILETDQRIPFHAAVIATGSKTARPPIEGLDHPHVMTHKEALDITEVPESVCIIGGGVIGAEFAQIFHGLGSKVTILEVMDKMLAQEDREISSALQARMETIGMTILLGVRVTRISAHGKETLTVHFQKGDRRETLKASRILLATGRHPFIQDLGLEKLGVEMAKQAIEVNDRMETSIGNVFAAGDCVGGMMLAHLATAQGEAAAKNALGISAKVNYNAVPRCVYTFPEIAACGQTEEEARTMGDVKIGRFPLAANGKACILGETYGMIKIIAEPRLNQVLGVMIIGPSATELIGTACLGMKLEMDVEELAETIMAHPTVSEIYREGAMTIGEGPIHLP